MDYLPSTSPQQVTDDEVANLRQQNFSDLLGKLRDELSCHVLPSDFPAQFTGNIKEEIEKRRQILRLMSGNCPPIVNQEIDKLTAEFHRPGQDREAEIIRLIQNFVGINNNPQKVKQLRQLIIDPDKAPPQLHLSRLARLFDDVKSGKIKNPQEYLLGLLARTTRRLTDLPGNALQLILNNLILFFDGALKDLSEGEKFTIKHNRVNTLEALAREKFTPIIDAYYKAQFFGFEKIQAMINEGDPLPEESIIPLVYSGLEPLFFLAKRGSTKDLEKCFKRYSHKLPMAYYKSNWQYPKVQLGHDNGALSSPMRDENNIEHQTRFIALGIKTFQAPEKFLKNIYESPHIHFKSVPRILGIACNFGNHQILTPLIVFFSTKGIIKENSDSKSNEQQLPKVEKKDFHLIFPEHFESMILFAAYEAKSALFKNWFLECGANPLKLLNKAILIQDDEARKTLLIDMLDRYIQEKSPNSSQAQVFKDALQLDQQFNVPALLSSNSPTFFENASENASVLRKLARLAKPFLEQHALIKTRNLTQKPL